MQCKATTTSLRVATAAVVYVRLQSYEESVYRRRDRNVTRQKLFLAVATGKYNPLDPYGIDYLFAA